MIQLFHLRGPSGKAPGKMKHGEVVCTMAQRQSYVVGLIVEAMVDLLREKPLDEISVCELAERAQVGRVSFYRNFADKDDVLRRYIECETDAWLAAEGRGYMDFDDPRDYVAFLLGHLYKYREIVDCLRRDGRMHLLEEEFDRRFAAALSGVSDPWHIAFTVGGFYKLFCYWASTGYAKTPEEVAAYI